MKLLRIALSSIVSLSMAALLAACMVSPAGSPADESPPAATEALPATVAVQALASDDLSSATSAPPPLSRCMAGGGICGWTAATCQASGGQVASGACGSPGVLCCFLDF